QLAIGEYKVITGNYKAEYGQVSSAAVTAATKSGTNEFKGETLTNKANRVPADAQAGLGPASQPFQQDLIFAKVDFEPTDNDRL
ncbi:hypothetical protein BU225_21030, partial [Stenotrophomonas sp. MB339]|uniref:hypothetical protein n=1 Tax=Stenotrophomonas sp. MB339 TaxID=1663558 RepID=UPI0009D5FFE9